MHRLPQFLKIFCIYRIDTRKYHGLYLFKSLYSFCTWPVFVGNRVPYLDFPCFFNSRNDIAYIPGFDDILGYLVQFQSPYFICKIFLARSNELYAIAFSNFTVFYFKVSHNPPERIEDRVKYQGLQGCIRIPDRCRNTFYDSIQYIWDSHSGLAGGWYNLFTLTADQFDDLIFDLLRHSSRQVHFVEDRDNFQIM